MCIIHAKSSSSTLPIIDMSNFAERQDEIQAAIMKAAVECGAFQVGAHTPSI